MRQALSILGTAVFVLSGVFGQSAPQLAFEVASVKPSKTLGGVRGGCHGIDSKYGSDTEAPPPLGRCVITDGRLSHIINIAFDLRSMALIKGGPGWVALGEDRFNIEAEAESPGKATEQQLLQMLQALLVERFQLKFHRQPVDVPGLALMVAKSGPKLKTAKGDDVVVRFGGPAGKPVLGQPISLAARHFSMAKLAETLSFLGTPVIDKTGLSGAYDIDLSWDDTNGPTLSTVLREDLGLRFEPQKASISLFVIDSAQKPTEN